MPEAAHSQQPQPPQYSPVVFGDNGWAAVTGGTLMVMTPAAKFSRPHTVQKLPTRRAI